MFPIGVLGVAGRFQPLLSKINTCFGLVVGLRVEYVVKEQMNSNSMRYREQHGKTIEIDRRTVVSP